MGCRKPAAGANTVASFGKACEINADADGRAENHNAPRADIVHSTRATKRSFMKLHYTLTQDNYLDFNIFHTLNSAPAKALLRKIRTQPPMVWLLAFFVFCGYSLYTSGQLPTMLAYIILSMSVLWYFLYPLCHRKTLEWRLKRRLAGGGREVMGEVALELLDDCLRAEDAGGAREVPCDEIERLVENKGCLYIYIGESSAFIVPRSAFANDEAHRQFSKNIEENMRAARKAHYAD